MDQTSNQDQATLAEDAPAVGFEPARKAGSPQVEISKCGAPRYDRANAERVRAAQRARGENF